MTERELFDFVVYMDTVVVPEKEIDFEVDAPAKRREHKTMTRGERRDRTIRKAMSRAQKDRRAKEKNHLPHDGKLGRYFKAKAFEDHFHHVCRQIDSHVWADETSKRDRIYEQRYNVRNGLAEYYDEPTYDYESEMEINYDVYLIDEDDRIHLVYKHHSFKAADKVATKYAELANVALCYCPNGKVAKEIGVLGFDDEFTAEYEGIYWTK